MPPLKLEKVVVAAALLSRKLTTNRWAGGIHTALAGTCVEKRADTPKVLVFLASQYSLFTMSICYNITLFSVSDGHFEVSGQTGNVCFGYGDDWVRTTIPGTFTAIVHACTLAVGSNGVPIALP